MAKISIIIPIYNTAAYLDRCLQSVVDQTHTDLEIILVNDGSTDGSGELCDTWAERDSRIKVIHQPNQGVSAARNAALDMATGDYIGFVDSDDYIDQHMFEKLVAPNATISICGLRKYHINGWEEDKAPDLLSEIPAAEALVMLMDDKHFEGFLWNKLFRSNLFHEIRLDANIHFLEDLLLVTQLFLKTDKIAYTSDILYYYVMRPTNAASRFNKKRLDEFKARRKIIELCKPVSAKATKIARYYYYRSYVGLARLAVRSVLKK